MRPLVILRPEPGNTLSVTRAAAMGFGEIVSIPLFKVRPAEWGPPDPSRFDAILLTSANAARHGGDGLEALKSLPVHAVGEATAKAARAAGLIVDRVGDGGVDALLERIGKDQRLLHLCGQERRIPRDAAQTIVPVTVYSSVAREAPEGLDRLEGAVACIHSPRAGRRLCALADEHGLDRSQIRLAAISAPSAADCGEGWAELAIASAPDDPTLLALAKRLCETGAEQEES